MTQRIVIADDDTDIRETLVFLLKTWFPTAEVHGFADGGRALASLPRLRPHLVITDISMPFLSGRDVAGMANLYDQPAFFIVISGNRDASLEDLRQANPRVVALLRKPFSHDELKRVCEHTLSKVKD